MEEAGEAAIIITAAEEAVTTAAAAATTVRSPPPPPRAASARRPPAPTPRTPATQATTASAAEAPFPIRPRHPVSWNNVDSLRRAAPRLTLSTAAGRFDDFFAMAALGCALAWTAGWAVLLV